MPEPSGYFREAGPGNRLEDPDQVVLALLIEHRCAEVLVVLVHATIPCHGGLEGGGGLTKWGNLSTHPNPMA